MPLMAVPDNGYICNRCSGPIKFLDAHVKMTIKLKGQTSPSPQRYCKNCCQDPAMAVLFNDVIGQHVEEIRLAAVWD